MPDVLTVGHLGRLPLRSALCWSLASAGGFTVLATQNMSVRAHSPWQDDPYDLVISFTQFVIPVLAAATCLRILRCRRDQPLPAVRTSDLLPPAR